MNNKATNEGCYPPRPSASVDNTLFDLLNSSYPTQPHLLIANYMLHAKNSRYGIAAFKTGSVTELYFDSPFL